MPDSISLSVRINHFVIHHLCYQSCAPAMQEAGVVAVAETQELRDLQAQQAEGHGSQLYPASASTDGPHPQGGPSEKDVQRLQAQLQQATRQDLANWLQLSSSMLGMQAADDGLNGDVNHDSDHENSSLPGSEPDDAISAMKDASDDHPNSNHNDPDAGSHQAGLHLAAADSDAKGNDRSEDDSDSDSDEEHRYVCPSQRFKVAQETAAAARNNLVACIAGFCKSLRDHRYAGPGQFLPLLAALLLHSQRLSADSMTIQAEIDICRDRLHDGQDNPHWPDAMQQFPAWSRQLHALNALQDQPTDSLPDVSQLLSSQEFWAGLPGQLHKQQCKKLALTALVRSVRQTFEVFKAALSDGRPGSKFWIFLSYNARWWDEKRSGEWTKA